MTSTGQTSAPTKPTTPAALRKRRQRDRQRAAGVVPTTVDVPEARVNDVRRLAADLCRVPDMQLTVAGIAERLATAEEVERSRDAAVAETASLRDRLADAERQAAVAAGREAAMAEQAEAARQEARTLAAELSATRAVVDGHRTDAASLVPLARLGQLLKATGGWRAGVARWLLGVPSEANT